MKFSRINPDQMRNLVNEAGMGYYFYYNEKKQEDYLFILADGTCIPSETLKDRFTPGTATFQDFSGGNTFPIDQENPEKSEIVDLAKAIDLLKSTATKMKMYLTINPQYKLPGVGSFPLVGSQTLSEDTRFFRVICSQSDFRYDSNSMVLRDSTYLMPYLDHLHSNSGFATVARFALPIPLPACYLFQYELPAGTQIRVGTVAPAFGQSGGGVEVMTENRVPAKQYGPIILPYY